MVTWLDEHGISEHARFIIESWLKAEGSADRIRDLIVGWLTANPAHQEFDFVIKTWLEATRDFATVRTLALSWLNQNTSSPDAVFVLKYICRERDLPSDTIKDVISWCTNFPDDPNTVSRIGPMLSHFAIGALEKPLIECSLLVLEGIQTEWIINDFFWYSALSMIGTLAWKIRFSDDIEPRLDAIHANVLRHSDAYSVALGRDTPPFVFNPVLARHMSGMIARKIIDPEVDCDALERFADWLAAWPSERKEKLRPALHSLERICPVPGLWSRVSGTDG